MWRSYILFFDILYIENYIDEVLYYMTKVLYLRTKVLYFGPFSNNEPRLEILNLVSNNEPEIPFQ